MKPAQAKQIYKDCIERNWVQIGDTLYPPAQAERLRGETGSKSVKKKNHSKGLKTGGIDDFRNIANKAKHTDQFTRLIELELKTEIWPEFYFTTDRKWRFDYCMPECKIAIEVEGGAWTRGRHTRPQGFIADMEKYNRAVADGWKLIRVTPQQLLSRETIFLIKKAIGSKHHGN